MSLRKVLYNKAIKESAIKMAFGKYSVVLEKALRSKVSIGIAWSVDHGMFRKTLQAYSAEFRGRREGACFNSS